MAQDEVDQPDPRRYALLRSMSGEAREIASCFFGFANAYLGASGEKQAPAATQLVTKHQQSAQLFSDLAKRLREVPNASVIDECLRQAELARFQGVPTASIKRATEEYSVAVGAPRANNSSEMLNAMHAADQEEEVDTQSDLDDPRMGHSGVGTVTGDAEPESDISIRQHPPGVDPVYSARLPARWHPYPGGTRIPYPASSVATEQPNRDGDEPVVDADEDLSNVSGVAEARGRDPPPAPPPTRARSQSRSSSRT